MGFLPTMIYEKSLYDVIEYVFFWEEIVIFLHNLEERKRRERKLISTLFLCPELWCCTWSFWLVCRDRHMRRGSFFLPSSVLHLDDYCRLIKPPGSKKCDGINGTEGQNGQRNIGESKGRKQQDWMRNFEPKKGLTSMVHPGAIKGDSYPANTKGGNDDDETQLIFRYVLKENCDWQETNFGNKLNNF